MSVMKYVGKYVKAEDAITSFDYLEIENALINIKEGAAILKEAAKRLNNAESYYTKDTLSISNETFNDKIQRCSNYFSSTANYMEDLTDSIKIAETKAIDRKQIILNDEAKILDQEKIKLEQIV